MSEQGAKLSTKIEGSRQEQIAMAKELSRDEITSYSGSAGAAEFLIFVLLVDFTDRERGG